LISCFVAVVYLVENDMISTPRSSDAANMRTSIVKFCIIFLQNISTRQIRDCNLGY